MIVKIYRLWKYHNLYMYKLLVILKSCMWNWFCFSFFCENIIFKFKNIFLCDKLTLLNYTYFTLENNIILLKYNILL